VNFDDPKPTKEKRRQKQIWLLPSIKERLDLEAAHRSISFSKMIEVACTHFLTDLDNKTQ